ncbi:tetratricopeptide repeat protein [Congregibacter variabilis]|uniref:Tetratricopeptide repeat protein n=1 Tax=Congregibacter variabilis TaxID=3081200 RepID=A0ABZ0I156_9GAMM|nr:tetratricopeptide repeat protein [Congregibacter sp. IMCC43200]
MAADTTLIGSLATMGALGLSLLVGIVWVIFGSSAEDELLLQKTRDRAVDNQQSLASGYRAVAAGDELDPDSSDGTPLAQYRLAKQFFSQYDHTGDPADLRSAHKLLLKSAEQQHPQAQAELGNSYLTGRGVVQDFPLAADWYKQAAENGVPEAMHELGKMARSGWGMEQSLVDAYVWLNLASARGDLRARDARSQLISQLTNEELMEAQRRSRELDQSIPRG